MKCHELVKHTNSRKEFLDAFGFCYQLAGSILLTDVNDPYTVGERNRLIELLLNTLSRPEDYSVDILDSLQKLALEK
jgi:hypothetical protein